MADVIRFMHPDTEEEIVVPSKYEVCSECRGKGTTVNPSIDGNGLSAEDFAEDPDFADNYWEGNYDVQCGVCNGNRVILEPDWAKMTPELRTTYEAYLEEKFQFERMCRAERDAERRMGA